jgi:hypothetical protein
MSPPQRDRARHHVNDLTGADRALFRKNLTENAVAAQPLHRDEMAGELTAGLARVNAGVGIQWLSAFLSEEKRSPPAARAKASRRRGRLRGRTKPERPGRRHRRGAELRPEAFV